MNILNKDELRDLEKIKNTYYMTPILETLENYQIKWGLEKSLNYLHDILSNSKEKVEYLLDERVNKGIIKVLSSSNQL